MEILLLRTQQGFAPADDDAREDIKRFKLGSVARMKVTLARNLRFHRKFFALLQVGYQYWSETCEPIEYKGRPVLPDFERFRKDVIISAGFYRPVWNIKGELRVEHESISFGSMTEERFNQLYDAVIRVLLEKVFNGARCKQWSEAELRQVVNDIESFA
jgi:hypothetical protein